MLSIYILALPICIADFTYHRIPNIYLIFIFYCIGIEGIFSGFASLGFLSLTLLILLLLHWLVGLGMGDVKLIFLITLALHIEGLSQLALLFLAICLGAMLAVICESLCRGHIGRTIAMAPSIFMGTALYLGAGNLNFLQEYADALVNSW